jgi:hypothetical protein
MRSVYVVVLVFFFLSCKEKEVEQDQRRVQLSEISFKIPQGLEYSQVDSGMALAKIVGEGIDTISVFNFGNTPVSLQANIERWKSQLKSFESQNIEKYHNETVYFIELLGGDECVLAAIIPSEDGTYYLKTKCEKKNHIVSKKAIKEMIESIQYK